MSPSGIDAISWTAVSSGCLTTRPSDETILWFELAHLISRPSSDSRGRWRLPRRALAFLKEMDSKAFSARREATAAAWQNEEKVLSASNFKAFIMNELINDSVCAYKHLPSSGYRFMLYRGLGLSSAWKSNTHSGQNGQIPLPILEHSPSGQIIFTGTMELNRSSGYVPRSIIRSAEQDRGVPRQTFD